MNVDPGVQAEMDQVQATCRDIIERYDKILGPSEATVSEPMGDASGIFDRGVRRLPFGYGIRQGCNRLRQLPYVLLDRLYIRLSAHRPSPPVR